MVEMASAKFVCIVDDSKLVEGLGGSKLAMPVEIVQFCHLYTLNRLQALPEVAGCVAKLRMEGERGGKPGGRRDLWVLASCCSTCLQIGREEQTGRTCGRLGCTRL
jgi:hypothetical protein